MSRILLGCAASVAIYKACDLASRLTRLGHEVRAVLTPRAAELVAPQLFEAVTGQPAAVSEFGPTRRAAMDHIELARFGEICVLAPATADLAARVALGLADDLLCTVVLALPSGTPRLFCPAMNPHMLEQPAVVRNLERLAEDGWQIVEPGVGVLACGDEGSGRLAEPETIVERVLAALRAASGDAGPA